MKYLFCTHANAGSLGPSIALAKELVRRGHNICFVSDPSITSWLGGEGLDYIPTENHRPTGFNARLWVDPDAVILQCAYILDAIRSFQPDVMVGHQLTLGPYIIREITGVPLAVIGLAAWMYPTRSGSGLWLLRDESEWREREFSARLNEVRERLSIPTSGKHFEETPIQGDVFLLRSIPALEGKVEDLPSRVHLIGALIEPLSTPAMDVIRWLGDCDARNCLYVQEGRTFDCPRFIDLVIETFKDTNIRVIVDFANTDGGLPSHWPCNFFAQAGICQSVALRRCGAVLATGHSTAVLSAICHGVPMLLFPNGSGTTDIAARCVAAGIASVVADSTLLTSADLRARVDDVYSESFREAAVRMQQGFSAYDSEAIAGDLLEELGCTRMPIVRKSIRSLQSSIRTPAIA